MSNSSIEWTSETWNPIVGCSKISEGCQSCYAIKDAHRLAGNPNPKINSVYEGLTERRAGRTEWTGKVRFVEERLQQPLRWKKPRMVFVNSMSDLFHEGVTDGQLDQIFAVMALTPQHTYQVLTKRPQRMLEYCNRLDLRRIINVAADLDLFMPSGTYTLKVPLNNVWLGVTAENQKAANERIPLLLQTPAAVRFLSCEPLLEEIDFLGTSVYEVEDRFSKGTWNPATMGQWEDFSVLNEIDWVIVGGESGHNARPCDIRWIKSIVEQCKNADISCFVKQLGSNARNLPVHCGNNGHSKGKMNYPGDWPWYLQVRQFPKTSAAA